MMGSRPKSASLVLAFFSLCLLFSGCVRAADSTAAKLPEELPDDAVYFPISYEPGTYNKRRFLPGRSFSKTSMGKQLLKISAGGESATCYLQFGGDGAPSCGSRTQDQDQPGLLLVGRAADSYLADLKPQQLPCETERHLTIAPADNTKMKVTGVWPCAKYAIFYHDSPDGPSHAIKIKLGVTGGLHARQPTNLVTASIRTAGNPLGVTLSRQPGKRFIYQLSCEEESSPRCSMQEIQNEPSTKHFIGVLYRGSFDDAKAPDVVLLKSSEARPTHLAACIYPSEGKVFRKMAFRSKVKLVNLSKWFPTTEAEIRLGKATIQSLPAVPTQPEAVFVPPNVVEESLEESQEPPLYPPLTLVHQASSFREAEIRLGKATILSESEGSSEIEGSIRQVHPDMEDAESVDANQPAVRVTLENQSNMRDGIPVPLVNSSNRKPRSRSPSPQLGIRRSRSLSPAALRTSGDGEGDGEPVPSANKVT